MNASKKLHKSTKSMLRKTSQFPRAMDQGKKEKFLANANTKVPESEEQAYKDLL